MGVILVYDYSVVSLLVMRCCDNEKGSIVIGIITRELIKEGNGRVKASMVITVPVIVSVLI